MGALTLARLLFETILFCIIKCSPLQGKCDHSYPAKDRELDRLSQKKFRAAMNLSSQAGVKILKNLPEDIRQEKDKKKFRGHVKRYTVVHKWLRFLCVLESVIGRKLTNKVLLLLWTLFSYLCLQLANFVKCNKNVL